MRALDFRDPTTPVRLAGILDVQPTAKGVRVSRLAPFTRAQVIDLALQWTASMPSGGRVAFVSDTTSIELDVQLMRLAYEGLPVPPAPFDLVVDGTLVASEGVDAGNLLRYADRTSLTPDLIPGPPATVRFDGLPSGAKRIELWLPHNAAIELRGLRVDEGASVEPAERQGRHWVHYGSSISHCSEALRPTEVWPVAAARAAGVDLTSLAIAGQAHLDQFAARTIRDLDAELISLKVGINVVNGDTLRERTFVPAAHGFLDTVRDGHPDTPIVVVTPIICPGVEDAPGPTVLGDDGKFRAAERTTEDRTGALSLTRIRALLQTVVTARQEAGDGNLHLFSGLELFGPDDVADLYDGLHPNPAGYLRMAERFTTLAFAPGRPFSQP